MNIVSSDDCIGVLTAHPFSTHFTVIGYKDGGYSVIPKSFFQNWLGEVTNPVSFHIGRCSGIGTGSIVKYDGAHQKLVIGKYVSGGQRLRFVLNGQHEVRTITIGMLSLYGMGLASPPVPQYADTVIRNDVWIGDEAFFLGGSIVESGCIIGARTVVPPNFRSEPYGIYVGSPARLVGFRFSEKVREKLLQLAWWDMPLDWVKCNNQAFLVDLKADEGRALDVLAGLQEAKDHYIEQMRVAADLGLEAASCAQHPAKHALLEGNAQAAGGGEPSSDLPLAQATAITDEFISTLTTLRELGQHPEAEAVARQMTLMLPEQAFGWQALGSALLLQGRADAARGPLDRAAQLLPAAVRTEPRLQNRSES